MKPKSGPFVLLHIFFNANKDGHFFGSLLRWVKSVIWKGAKTFGGETLRTGGKILSDIAESSSPKVSAGDVSIHVTESTQN